jgi:5-methyltetrahydrofolate--homocysteine methyltransferase
MNAPVPSPVESRLRELLARRILILDGAMGTMIQREHLTEADFRGERFAAHAVDVRGNNDLLSLTRPATDSRDPRGLSGGRRRPSRNQHLRRQFDRAGRLSTGASRLRDESRSSAAGEAGLREAVDGGQAAVRRRRARSHAEDRVDLARRQRSGRAQRHVRPAGRQLRRAGARGLLDGGADLLLVETIFDTLNAKAALFAIDAEFERRAKDGLPRVPLMISGTVTDASGGSCPGRPSRRSGTRCGTRDRSPSVSTARSVPR